MLSAHFLSRLRKYESPDAARNPPCIPPPAFLSYRPSIPLSIPLKSDSHSSITLDIPPLARKIQEPSNYDPTIQSARLKTLIHALQSPPNFDPKSGSYPLACEWTSTVLATLLVDYMHLTHCDIHFPHLVQFYHHQPVLHLHTQNYDDQAWVALTWLRAAAYVSAALGDRTWRTKFLSRARWFYALVRRGWDEKCCGGGMYWGRWSRYKNAVTSELFVDLCGAVYEVSKDSRDLEWAVRGWVWFRESGMVLSLIHI